MIYSQRKLKVFLKINHPFFILIPETALKTRSPPRQKSAPKCPAGNTPANPAQTPACLSALKTHTAKSYHQSKRFGEVPPPSARPNPKRSKIIFCSRLSNSLYWFKYCLTGLVISDRYASLASCKRQPNRTHLEYFLASASRTQFKQCCPTE